jgi:streptogramin lyase
MRSIQAFSVFATALTLHVSAAPALLERDTSRFTYYDMTTPLIGPCDLAVGPDGALWGQGILVDTFFRVDPATGRVDEYPIPFTTPLSSTVIPIQGGQQPTNLNLRPQVGWLDPEPTSDWLVGWL